MGATTDDVGTAVLRALANRPRMHVVELSEAVGVPPSTVDRTCTRLVRAGHVRACGGADFSITARGQRQVRAR